MAAIAEDKQRNSINDAVADLGTDIAQAFTGFQKYLYLDVDVA